MRQDLLQTLIERKIVGPYTEVDVAVPIVGLGGECLDRQVRSYVVMDTPRLEGSTWVMIGADTVHGKRRTIRGHDIVAIDGMEPERVADTYDLCEDGSPKKLGKRRGRKPKHVKAAMAENNAVAQA